ncbi:MAG: hypothetical protein A3A80_01655 [Candidatus Terrybacteria bacterium RIFCSPLOWO2_01_FULL_44_24]|uniref:NTP pyrophosphohydrolase MazG-like domain-containing protein n=1 Tax=Candidatus Terrybacteria bacterium RIFCSPHIGHO2_01_FULL_43_35 TaxID=1802361 RepID=A0A1G2PFN3_9BACT|nr:MAG: hypothetical protein A2828_04035 [Candidatus Terrybacteria bacterium RIFCSPHIGHO2_01_FULL_43_35]OHA49898.1 MAG: hypothetical protein A3B75_03270 [Candidatus Terrybacteria bacterium RIFCSPHIGHO2_02_FULL_43_14]OHA51781.1 MAG: hypothetical protein A3A80_01655 [Candidatus Terrybacteria bacterium RIFCSPLOWO2_01_FULL_44_24]
MTFEEYQKISRETAEYPDKDNNYIYPVLGLTGEAGEVAEKVKKVIRNDGGKMSEDKKIEIAKELGDVLWYLAQIATELGLKLEDVARMNIDKLKSRKERGTIASSGDNR